MGKKGKLKFEEGEKLLCFHNHLIYEAKCISVNPNADEDKYYKIHYQGWNKSWDEWVPEERLLKYIDSNLDLQKKLNQGATASSASKSKKKKTSLPSSSEPPITSTDSTITDEPEIKIKLSEEIIGWLIDDENQIKQKRLAVLPAKTNVVTILKDFVKHKKSVSKLSTEKELILAEMSSGLVDFFDVMLGPQLLYKFERPQYQMMLKEHGENYSAASLYGVSHLLRLLTKIGPVLKYVNLDDDSISNIVGHIQELVRYLNKYAGPLFKVEDIYHQAAPDYLKKVAAL